MITLHGIHYNRRLISLLILLYFIIYAASPLIHINNGTYGGMNINSTGKTSFTEKGVHIFLLDLFFSTLLHSNNSPDGTSTSVSFVRKSRAILSVDPASKLVSFSNMLSGHRSIVVSVTLLFVLPVIFEVFTLQQGYVPPYSGHSPPIS